MSRQPPANPTSFVEAAPTRNDKWCQRPGLNRRPKAYESSALPLSYSGGPVAPIYAGSKRGSKHFRGWRHGIGRRLDKPGALAILRSRADAIDKFKIMRIKFLLLLTGGIFSAALAAHANTAVTMQSTSAPDVEQSLVRMGGSEVATLIQAYDTLAVADHDYKGHRVHAMKAIEAACKLLGTNISGEGKGKEKQTLSDEQLRSVLSSIQQVRGSLAVAGTQQQVVKHLDVAIQQLTIALSIK